MILSFAQTRLVSRDESVTRAVAQQAKQRPLGVVKAETLEIAQLERKAHLPPPSARWQDRGRFRWDRRVGPSTRSRATLFPWSRKGMAENVPEEPPPMMQTCRTMREVVKIVVVAGLGLGPRRNQQ